MVALQHLLLLLLLLPLLLFLSHVPHSQHPTHTSDTPADIMADSQHIPYLLTALGTNLNVAFVTSCGYLSYIFTTFLFLISINLISFLCRKLIVKYHTINSQHTIN